MMQMRRRNPPNALDSEEQVQNQGTAPQSNARFTPSPPPSAISSSVSHSHRQSSRYPRDRAPAAATTSPSQRSFSFRSALFNSSNQHIQVVEKDPATSETLLQHSVMINDKGHSAVRGVTLSRRGRRHCLCGIVTLLVLLGAAVILAMFGFYLRSYNSEFEESAEAKQYISELIQQVYEASDLEWKIKFNPYGTKKRDFNFTYYKNETAIQEYLDHLTNHLNSDRMQQHIRELLEFPTEKLPSHFDAREKWPYCQSMFDVPNQGSCGSCFAVAAVGVASDRACIASNGTVQSLFSVEDVLDCCSVCGNCYGGDPLKAFVYWVLEGLVTGDRDGCRPYTADLSCGIPCSPAYYPQTESKRKCRRECQNIYFKYNYQDDKHYASLAYSMYPRSMSLNTDGSKRADVPTVIGQLNETAEEPLTDEEVRTLVMKELYLSGPTTLAFPITEEFLHYSSGIFSPYPVTNISDRIVYWHVVRLIGWGKYDGGKHYWLAINSFGRHWGENGLFRLDPELLETYGLEYETALV